MCAVVILMSEKVALNRLEAHNGTKKHIKNSPGLVSQSKLDLSSISISQKKVDKAELLYVNYLAEHNDAVLAADNFTHFCEKMFPDNEIDHNYKRSQTKATVLTKDVPAREIQKQVISQMKNARYFSVLLDESTD